MQLNRFILIRRTGKILLQYLLARFQSDRIGDKYIPGKPLKICMYGTPGLWNTGADTRTYEIIRQVKHILGSDKINIRIAVLDKLPLHKSHYEDLKLRPANDNLMVPEQYYGKAEYIRPNKFIMNSTLLSHIDQAHGFMIVDGGLFLTGVNFIFTLPLVLCMHRANEQNKFSLAYGVEASESPWPLPHLYQKLLNNSKSTIITRNSSNNALKRLGLNIKLGTDTAWTFSPLPSSYGKKVLSKQGWDQKIKILAICPNHLHAIQRRTQNSEDNSCYNIHVINSFVNAIKAFSHHNPIFIIVISMTRGDIPFSKLLSSELGGVPHFSSGDYDMFQLVSILRCSNFIVSSRYHAILLSMPAGIPSGWIGSINDPRYIEIFKDRKHLKLVADMSDLQFEQKLLELLKQLNYESEHIKNEIYKSTVNNLKKMSHMGKVLKAVVSDCYPEFYISDNKKFWYDFLPPLDSNIIDILEHYT